MCNMPKGIPVATMSLGSHGAVNAALFAAAILAVGDADIRSRLIAFREAQTAAVPETP
jgi:5-(carboxyamino)imidazole ribonucleotide mutase